jgi:hypothetical protein
MSRALGWRLEFDVLRSQQYVIGFQLRLDEAVAMGDRVIAWRRTGDPTAER